MSEYPLDEILERLISTMKEDYTLYHILKTLTDNDNYDEFLECWK